MKVLAVGQRSDDLASAAVDRQRRPEPLLYHHQHHHHRYHHHHHHQQITSSTAEIPQFRSAARQMPRSLVKHGSSLVKLFFGSLQNPFSALTLLTGMTSDSISRPFFGSGERVLVSFIGAKDDGSGGHNWSSVSRYQNVSILDFIGAMGDGAGTEAIRRAKLQSNRHHQQTNIQYFTGRMPFLSPNQQCQSTEGKISHSMDLLTPSSLGGLPTLSLTTNSSWLPWGRVAMPLISPLMPVPHLPVKYLVVL